MASILTTYLGLPWQSSASLDARVTVDDLFDSSCTYCGLPTSARNTNQLRVPKGSVTGGSIRAAHVAGSRSAASRHGAAGLGYLPGYETVLLGRDALRRVAVNLPSVAAILQSDDAVGEVRASGDFVHAAGADGARSPVGNVRHCDACDSTFLLPTEFLDLAVPSSAIETGSTWFVGGFRNRVQLFVREDVHRLLFPRNRRCDRATVYPAEDCFDLRDYAAKFIFEAYRR